MTKIVLTRAELHARVWSTPTIRLAREFGISDVALAKLCRRRNIPKPPRGYWCRIDMGHAPGKVALPEARAGEDREVVFDVDANLRRRSAHPMHVESAQLTAPTTSPTPAARAVPKVSLPAAGMPLHPIADRLRKFLLLVKPDPDGRVHIREKGLPTVRASPAQAGRLARIIHAMVSSATQRKVVVAAPVASPALEFRFGDICLTVAIEEELSAMIPARLAVKNAYDKQGRNGSPQPSGKLTYRLNFNWQACPVEADESVVNLMSTCMDNFVFRQKSAAEVGASVTRAVGQH